MNLSINYDRNKFTKVYRLHRLKSRIIYSPPSSVIIKTVELGPSPSGLKTWSDTRYWVNVSRFVISWLYMNESATKRTEKILNFLHCRFLYLLCFFFFSAFQSAVKRTANKLIIQINYGTYLNIAISDINLLNVFRLFVSSAISNAIPEKFSMNRVSRRRLPRNSYGGWRCVVGFFASTRNWNGNVFIRDN